MAEGKRALVTGAAGEMGHGLLPGLRAAGWEIVGLDLAPLAPELAANCVETSIASVTDVKVLQALFSRHHFDAVFHLAATLSSKAETDPDLAHAINVDATVQLFRLSREDARAIGRSVRFLFPSSIAVYGLGGRDAKSKAGAVSEHQWLEPTGAYGIHKLYAERLGNYFTKRALHEKAPGLDFRAIRFPGLISAETLPTGGTSDYAPEMIHAAAQGRPYACFVDAETRIPFMTMPDAIAAFLKLASASAEALTTRVYNIGSFSPSAAEIRAVVLEHFPDAAITFEPVPFRQAIVDTWPADLDDRKARADWGHAPRHGLREAVADYMVPALLRRYAATGRSSH